MNGLAGVDIVVSKYAPPPRPSTPGEDAVRLVRHGLGDVLSWLGEMPGARPGDLVHTSILIGRTASVHPDTYAVLRGAL